MVESSSTEVKGPPGPPPRSPARLQRTNPGSPGSYLSGFVAEEDLDEDSPNYFARPRLDVKNLTSLENFHEPEAAPPPNYEESDTSYGVDENGTPHYVTVRTVSNPQTSPASKQPHVWHLKGTSITLSALEATVLVKAGILGYHDLRL